MSIPEPDRDPGQTVEDQIPGDIPGEAVAFLKEMGYLESDRLHVGAAVPALALPLLDSGAGVVIGASTADRPTVLIFGSYT